MSTLMSTYNLQISKKPLKQGLLTYRMAEKEGFEPSIRY